MSGHPSLLVGRPHGVCGFTGTSKAPGMTAEQRATVRWVLTYVDELHLGDCVNADAQAYDDAIALDVKVIGHPPSEDGRRAFCVYDEERPPVAYIARNHAIVDESPDGLIAAPHTATEVQRSGTWATIRYARKQGSCSLDRCT